MCCNDGHGFYLHAILTISIGVCSIFGDLGLRYGKSALERAALDNATHATVGGLTWTLILVLQQKSLVRNLNSIFFCSLIASFVDLDHFVVARSWNIKNATQLEKRPFLHCTTIPILLWLFFFLLSRTFHSLMLENTSWIILAAFLSHHIRDGTRRGLWFCPFGSTPPISYCLYVSLNIVLPYILYWLMSQCTFSRKSYCNVIEV